LGYLREILLVTVLKKWLIRFFGFTTTDDIEDLMNYRLKAQKSSEIYRYVLFISNHQTYFADVVAMFHVFNASLKGRDNIKNVLYLWNLN
jgi:hypothetical protein